jgi:hypothetical protein
MSVTHEEDSTINHQNESTLLAPLEKTPQVPQEASNFKVGVHMARGVA